MVSCGSGSGSGSGGGGGSGDGNGNGNGNGGTNLSKARVHRIALTGGPCGGKTSLQVTLSDVFENMGWKVYRVPEAATLLLGFIKHATWGGVVFSQLDAGQSKQFQADLLSVMLSLEDTYMKLACSFAAKGQKAIVICDRGAMDPSAYMPRSEWLECLEQLGLSEVSLRDERYDCVVHLVTTAKGAEAYFGSENNPTRAEGIELARRLDELVAKAWIGHPYYDVIDNSTGFEEKQRRVISAVLNRLSLKDNRQGKGVVKRKFLVRNFTMDAPFPIAYRDFDVEHDYVLSSDPDTKTRIRKRGYDNNHVHSITQCVTVNHDTGEQYELRHAIPAWEYNLLWHQRDPTRCSIVKKRRCFLWDSDYYQIDCYQSPKPGLCLLEAYLDSSVDKSNRIPPFLSIEKEVTGDKFYSMFHLAMV